jgi:RNA polymerase sigma-70 factor (ECF subfamily)
VPFASEKLFADAAAGDRAAFGTLLEVYLPQLHAFVHARLGGSLEPRESSVDVVQSVCRQILAARAASEFEGEEHFRAWLFTCALNKVREKMRFHRGALRDVGREEPRAARDPLTSVAHLLTPSREAVGKETADALGAALAALSEEHREVIALARLAELPHAVIAEVMSRSEEAVRQLLARALLRLTQELRARGVALARPRRARES